MLFALQISIHVQRHVSSNILNQEKISIFLILPFSDGHLNSRFRVAAGLYWHLNARSAENSEMNDTIITAVFNLEFSNKM
jgi:hypothetical protein